MLRRPALLLVLILGTTSATPHPAEPRSATPRATTSSVTAASLTAPSTPLSVTAPTVTAPSIAGPRADSWGPFQARRVASPSGRFYVLLQPERTKCRYEVCKRKDGSAPMRSAKVASRLDRALEARGKRAAASGFELVDSIARAAGDAQLCTGLFDQLPLKTHMLDDGRVVFFDQYAGVGYGTTIACVQTDGEIGFAHDLTTLFGRVPRGTMHTVSSRWWSRDHWVDPIDEVVVLLTAGEEARAVSLDDGTITGPTGAMWLRRITAAAPSERAIAIDGAIADLSPAELASIRDAVDRLEPDDHDSTWSLRIARLRHAADGDDGRCAAEFEHAVATAEDQQVWLYAVRHLGSVRGVEALPTLRRLLLETVGHQQQHVLTASFLDLGDAGVPILCSVVLDPEATDESRTRAVRTLGELASPLSLEPMFEMVERHRAPRGSLEYLMVDTMVSILASKDCSDTAREDAAPRLVTLLNADWQPKYGNLARYRIADHFLHHPYGPAAAPLRAHARQLEEAKRFRLENAAKGCEAVGG